MSEVQGKSRWRVIGTSVQGAQHKRLGIPNQDAIRWVPASGEGPPYILAVSDGHGSTKCFRSHWGAKMAVSVATRILQRFLERQPTLADLPAITRQAEEILPRGLAETWADLVKGDLKRCPFSQAELEELNRREGVAAQKAVENHPLLAYGATLLSVLVTDTFILYLQLGDGDILTVTETNEVARPLPRDDRLVANETTSLCAPEAWQDFRIQFQPLVEVSPALILLATDGYANSFRDEVGFFQVGTDLLKVIRSESLEYARTSLESWLTETSQRGSGDDITLGVLCRLDATRSVHESGEL